MKLIRPLALIAAAALLLVPVAAQADTAAGYDTRRDVQYVTLDDQGNVTSDPAVAVPDRTQGDVSRVRITHGTDRVRVLLHYRELARSGFFHEHQVEFHTGTRVRVVLVDAQPGSWAGTATTYTGGGTKVRCAVRRKIDYDANTVAVSIPRSCLGNPRWVRVGAGTLTTYGHKLYFDDALRDGGSFSDNLVLSMRIRR